jgi:hypothetical protein
LFRLPEWPTDEHDHLVRWTLWSGGVAMVSHLSALNRVRHVSAIRRTHSIPDHLLRRPGDTVGTRVSAHRPAPHQQFSPRPDGHRLNAAG